MKNGDLEISWEELGNSLAGIFENSEATIHKANDIAAQKMISGNESAKIMAAILRVRDACGIDNENVSLFMRQQDNRAFCQAVVSACWNMPGKDMDFEAWNDEARTICEMIEDNRWELAHDHALNIQEGAIEHDGVGIDSEYIARLHDQFMRQNRIGVMAIFSSDAQDDSLRLAIAMSGDYPDETGCVSIDPRGRMLFENRAFDKQYKIVFETIGTGGQKDFVEKAMRKFSGKNQENAPKFY